MVNENLSLADVTRREVEKYVGRTQGAAMHSFLDDKQQRYSVVIVPESPAERPAYVAVMARVVGEYAS